MRPSLSSFCRACRPALRKGCLVTQRERELNHTEILTGVYAQAERAKKWLKRYWAKKLA
jgi:hypothetical protein